MSIAHILPIGKSQGALWSTSPRSTWSSCRSCWQPPWSRVCGSAQSTRRLRLEGVGLLARRPGRPPAAAFRSARRHRAVACLDVGASLLHPVARQCRLDPAALPRHRVLLLLVPSRQPPGALVLGDPCGAPLTEFAEPVGGLSPRLDRQVHRHGAVLPAADLARLPPRAGADPPSRSTCSTSSGCMPPGSRSSGRWSGSSTRRRTTACTMRATSTTSTPTTAAC